MDKTHKIYKVAYSFFRVLLFLIYPVKAVGRENVPEGSALLCGNHSHWTDPLLMAFAITSKVHISFMAKAELIKGVVGKVLSAIGTFPVDRDAADLNAIKTAFRILKSGKKVGIFPEGTRTENDDDVAPKAGAIRLAEQTAAPIVPVYIPRQKKLFRPVTVVIGTPYIIERQRGVKRTHEEYNKLSEELMDNIKALGEGVI